MNKSLNPKTISAPVGAYSHAIEVPPGTRWLYISGQIGVRPDGSVAKGAEAQCEQIWQNISAILLSARMGPRDLVRVNSFLTRSEDIAVARAVRSKYLDGHEPASTLLIVAGLASPDYLMEIEAVAAKT